MNNSTEKFTAYFRKVQKAIDAIDSNSLETVLNAIYSCYQGQNIMYLFGNGGSAATASHVTGDFLKGISFQLDKRFKSICLNDNLAGVSAISNDLTYEEVFIEQLKTFLTKEDLVIGISGSGNSMNVIKALEYAQSTGAQTIAFTGYKGGKVKDIADLVVHVPINDMEIVEDIHIMIFHAIKQIIIEELKGDDFSMGYNYDKRINE
jgi:D-sedoheptulose 7-phosphate isomerase